MIDASEENCIYCSKYLFGLNEFNRRMHIETCKVRKLVESNTSNFNMSTSDANSQQVNNNQSQAQALDEYIIVGDNCTYCFKSFKDFKSDFNKRLHIKCCKIKRDAYESKAQQNANKSANNLSNISLNLSQISSIANNSANNGNNNSQINLGNLSECCLFCTKPLGNLNEFNKRMHVENCKIRKSIEGNLTPVPNGRRKMKDENLAKLGMELGSQCVYCSKSYANLSDFNKKLHFEYCKQKKKKLKEMNASIQAAAAAVASTSSQSSSMMSNQNDTTSNNDSHVNNSKKNNNHSSSNHNNNSNYPDLGESCLFCSRSLFNLSNFNKKVHVETCKIKQLKKANAYKMKHTNTLNKLTSPNGQTQNKKKKQQPKKESTLNYCQPSNLISPLNAAMNAIVQQQQNATMNALVQQQQEQQHQHQQHQQQNNQNRLANQYDQLASLQLNLSSLDPNVSLLASLSSNQTNNQSNNNNPINLSHLQLPVQLNDPNGGGGIFI